MSKIPNAAKLAVIAAALMFVAAGPASVPDSSGYTTIDAKQQLGADVVAQITNAAIALNTAGAFGGVIDASGFSGNLTCTSSYNYMVLNWPVKNKSFPITILWGTAIPGTSCFQVVPPGVQVVQKTPSQGPAFGSNLFANSSTLPAGSAASNATVTITIASPGVISDPNTCTATSTLSGCVAPGSTVSFTTSGSLPTGIVSGTKYFVIAAGFTAGTSYEIAATQGGAAINTSGSQSGTQTRTNNVNPNPAAYFVAASGGSDSNIGTLQAPFATLTHAQTAMRNSSGNVLTTYLRGGSGGGYTFSGSCTGSGIDLTSADAGETWSYYPQDGIGSAILDGGGSITSNSTGVAQIFNIDGGANNPNNITINGLQFQHTCLYAILTGAATGHNVTGTLLINNIFHDGNNIAIHFNDNTTNNVAAFNQCYNLGQRCLSAITDTNGLVNNGLTWGNNAAFNTCNSITINGGDCAAYYMQNNEATLSTGGAVVNNLVRDSGMANSALGKGIYNDNGQSNTWVAGNIITGTLYSCFNNNTGTANIYIFNICDMSWSAQQYANISGSPAAPPLFTNNLFITCSNFDVFQWSGTATITENFYWSYCGSVPGFTNDIAGITVNPMIVDPVKFTLAANSPLNGPPYYWPYQQQNWGPPGIALPNFGQPSSVPQNGTVGAVTSLSQFPANQNFVDNGDFAIDQVFPTSLIASTATNIPTSLTRAVDRWLCNYTASTSGSGTPTSQRLASTAGMGNVPSMFEIKANATPASSSPAAMLTYCAINIEGSTVAALQWGTANAQPLTLSVLLKSSIANPIFGISVQGASSNQSFVVNCNLGGTSNATPCKFTIPGPTTGTWTSNNQQNTVGLKLSIASQCGSTFQAPNVNMWLVGTYYCTAEQTQQLASASSTLDISEVKLEPGSIPTPFVADPTPIAYQKAQRWLRSSFTPGTTPAAAVKVGAFCTQTVGTTGGTSGVNVQFSPPMGASPTITTYNPNTAAAATWRDYTASADLAVSVDPQSTKNANGFFIDESAAPAAAAHTICIHWQADAGGGNF